jgi:hypothetical protein
MGVAGHHGGTEKHVEHRGHRNLNRSDALCGFLPQFSVYLCALCVSVVNYSRNINPES